MSASDSGAAALENGTSNNTQETAREMRPGGILVKKTDGKTAGGGGDDHGVSGGGGAPAKIKIKVSFGSNQHDLSVPSDSTFGDLKRIIAQVSGLEPKVQKLLFRGIEKEDDDYLHMAGVKDNSKILLMEVAMTKNENPEEVNVPPSEVLIGGEAVAEVRVEVDKLSEQVSALEAVVNGGSKVDEKDIIYLTEMLMRQLLKLDGIEAQGEGKVQRKIEVRRVQSFVETMDAIKARNSNPFIDSSNAVSVTPQWETFESGVGSLNSPSHLPASTKVTQDWEQFE